MGSLPGVRRPTGGLFCFVAKPEGIATDSWGPIGLRTFNVRTFTRGDRRMHDQIEKIDIHRMAQKLDHELGRIPNDVALSPEQRRLLLRFLSDARAGRLPGKRSARRLSNGRCLKYITAMRRFALHVRTPFEEVTVAQMEDFIFGLETGRVQKLVLIGGTSSYSPETVLDFKKMLRRFYKWLFGECVRYQDLTSWFDTRDQLPVLEVFGPDAAQRMARRWGVPESRLRSLGSANCRSPCCTTQALTNHSSQAMRPRSGL